MSILVAHSYYLRLDAKQLRKMKPYPPLGTLITAAAVRARGFDVKLFDAMLAEGVHEFAASLDAAGPAIVGILEDNFNFLTKMCTLRMREACLEMVQLASARGCRVVVNGSDASDHPDRYLAAGADAVITGPVEPAFVELVDLWSRDAHAAADQVAGLALAQADGAVRYTAVRSAITDLDALPLPAWDLVDADRYRESWRGGHGRFSWNMVASRGCPYACNWCAKPLFGRRYAQRSAAGVAAEVRRLLDDVGPDHIWFADDIFGLTATWIRTFADEITRLDARTPFMMQSRANLMTAPTVAALREAGAEEVWLGVESGSQRILDAMEKGTRIEQIRQATRNLKANGVRVGWFIQLGYLGEEWADLVQTRDLMRTERPDDIGVSVSYPLPGTGFYDAVREHLGAKRNWDDTDDLDMLFHGTYVADFYRRVRDLLHREAEIWPQHGSIEALEHEWSELERSEAEFRNPVAIGV
jgi:anaerobic magnesium-protoporphyrin IX monomethyl ester cyclase